MKHSPKQLVLAVVLAALGAISNAQPAPTPYGAAAAGAPAAPGTRQDQRMRTFDPAQMQARIAERQVRMKQKLQITPAQDAAWATWIASSARPANWQRPDRSEFERLTTPERIDRMRALRAERMARMDQHGEATKTFYAALSAEQRRVFDEETARRGHRGMHGQHHPKG